MIKDKRVVGLDAYAAMYVLMLAGSASFMTPIGYQLNMMAHAAGGYKWADWARFGVPLQIIVCIVGVIGAHYFY
jgi:di/tricarboxylate transporter